MAPNNYSQLATLKGETARGCGRFLIGTLRVDGLATAQEAPSRGEVEKLSTPGAESCQVALRTCSAVPPGSNPHPCF